MIVAAALSPCVDRTLVVERLIVGAVHRPGTVSVTAGGKGFNLARAARRLGGSVTAAGIVGGHAGRWLRAELERDGVTAALIDGHGETRTSVSIADLGSGVMTDLYEPATPIEGDEWDRLRQGVAERLARGDWLAICGTLPAGAPPGAIAGLIAVARDRGAFVAVDTHGAPLAEAVAAGPDIVKVNLIEAAGLLSPTAEGTDNDPTASAAGAVELAERLTTRLASTTAMGLGIVTAGVDGAAGGGWQVRGPRTAGAYPVGSGDSFLAAMLVTLDGHRDWRRHVPAALRRGAGAAMANALISGAAVFDATVAARLAEDCELLAVTPSA